MFKNKLLILLYFTVILVPQTKSNYFSFIFLLYVALNLTANHDFTLSHYLRHILLCNLSLLRIWSPLNILTTNYEFSPSLVYYTFSSLVLFWVISGDSQRLIMVLCSDITSGSSGFTWVPGIPSGSIAWRKVSLQLGYISQLYYFSSGIITDFAFVHHLLP